MMTGINRVLIIDDEPLFIKKLRIAFNSFAFIEAFGAEQALRLTAENSYELILLDLNLDNATTDLDGLELIRPIKSQSPDTPLVVVTSDERVETIVTAMKLGADDFLRKSGFDPLAWRRKFDLLIENRTLTRRLHGIEAEKFPFIGDSPGLLEIKKSLEILANEPKLTLLITGETGVGKEVAARYLHHHSPRKNKPFVTVNLPAIPDTLLESTLFGHKRGAFTGADTDYAGLFRQADTGILFLDEIGEINRSLQAKLLRFLETKRVQAVGDDKEIELDVQIIAATNRDPLELVSSGQLRKDLYYRLRHMTLEIPPLRERADDCKKILDFYLGRAGYQSADDILEPEVRGILMEYHWPGNVRELKNTVDSMLLRSRVLKKARVDESCLPAELRDRTLLKNTPPGRDLLKMTPSELDQTVAVTELEAIETALNKTYGQKQAAARLLGINMDQMRYRVLKFWDVFPELVLKHPIITSRYKLSKGDTNVLNDI